MAIAPHPFSKIMIRYPLILALSLLVEVHAEDADFKILKMIEIRETILDKENAVAFTNANEISMHMHVIKKGIEESQSYQFEITEAKDSTGEKLKLGGFKPEAFVAVRGRPQPGRLEVELSVTAPSRSATSLDVKGFLLVNSGTRQNIMLTGLNSKEPRELNHELLKKCGIKVRVHSENEEALTVKVEGDSNKIADVQILSEKGRPMTRGSRTDGGGDSLKKTFYLREPVTEGSILSLSVIVDLKLEKIPFDLREVVLP